MEYRRNITLSSRFWITILIVFCLVAYLICSTIDGAFEQRKAEYDRLAEQRDELRQELSLLQRELDYIRSDAGIERYARAIGMIKPGEVKYTPVER